MPTAKLWLTGVAAFQLLSPDWLAWIVQEYPGSDEAKEAAKLLEQIKKDGRP